VIDLIHVTKTHRRGETTITALRDVTCTIPAGRFTFIVGPSGSGKSSLLYLIGALDEPTAGDVIVAGRNLKRASPRERDQYRRHEVGFVFQNFNLLNNLDAVENVLVPFLPTGQYASRRAEAVELLRRVGLGARLEHRPSQLSGGEQQRVAIARALLKRPKLVLADEPTGELDSSTGAEIFEQLRSMQRDLGTTVIVVTHDRTHLRAGDLVLTIRDGRLCPPTVPE